MNGMNIVDMIIVSLIIVFICLIGIGVYDVYLNKDITINQVKFVSTNDHYMVIDDCMHMYYAEDPILLKVKYSISQNVSSEISVKHSIFHGHQIIDVKPFGKDLPATCGVYG